MAAAAATAGTALALYFFSRSSKSCQGGHETHATAHAAPRSFLEDIYFFAEGLRYTYGETFGKWRAADLLIGLMYLCRRDSDVHPVADIAQQGHVFDIGTSPEERHRNIAYLHRIERFFKYCSGLRERRPVFQRRYYVEVMGIPEEDILLQSLKAGVLKPSYILVRDRELKSIVLAIRGTHSFKDAFTSLTGASKPHHVIDSNGVVLGYSHFGMLAAARWLKTQISEQLAAALAENPGYNLEIMGHSLGGGTAAMLTMMLRETGGIFTNATCTAIACPACMTLELAKSCADYVTSVIHNTDVIPTISPGSADALRSEVARSSWSHDFRQELRSSSVVRVMESSLRGVGSATAAATTWTATRLSACYQQRLSYKNKRKVQNDDPPTIKRRNSDENLVAQASTEGVSVEFQSSSRQGSAPAQLLTTQGSYMSEIDAVIDYDDIDDSESISTLGLDGQDSTLRAEANIRMNEVAQAVMAAENEEAKAKEGDDARVPSVIRPGSYGNTSAASNSKNRSADTVEWRRMMYPAGRIMHLVPARLVPGSSFANSASQMNFINDADADWPEAEMEEGDDYPLSPLPSKPSQDLDEFYEVENGVRSHSRHISEISLKDMITAEEASGSTAGPAGNHGPLPPLKPPIGPPPEPMVLLDNVPQEAYNRIKLCPTVLSDHVIPNYLRSLASFTERL